MYSLRHYTTLLDMRAWLVILNQTTYGDEPGARFIVNEDIDRSPAKNKMNPPQSSTRRGPGRPPSTGKGKGKGKCSGSKKDKGGDNGGRGGSGGCGGSGGSAGGLGFGGGTGNSGTISIC